MRAMHRATLAFALALASTRALSQQRVPWDVLRFVEQSSKFITLPFAPTPRARVIQPGESLGPLELYPLDDVVMGGASSSTYSGGRWSGSVTSANNGGFVGARSKALALDLTRCAGLALTVASDGALRRYKCGLRDSTDFNGIVYTASFDADGSAEQTLTLPFETFVPTRFAKTVPGASLDRRNVRAFQLALSKFEYDGGLSPAFREGPFRLDVLDVRTY